MCEILAIAPSCGANPPGVTKLYWVATEDVTSFSAVDLEDLSVSTITMASGKKFQLLGTLKEETSVESEKVGTNDTSSFTHKVIGKIKGQEQAVNAALSKAVGTAMIVLAQCSNGDVLIIGDKTNYAELSVLKSMTGKNGGTDRKGSDFEIVSMGHSILPTYFTGTLATIIA